ncbi:unnamed protein product [Mytilus coruscus]|uniref:DZIP3-like HEPN domain-containing protein n=1 Tax=Mytilus coruscus TaxID=42192 RepID=A0A6J8BJU9_MYTCO|nr:unnamed protein product [Mytilus coruscus]
MGQRDFALLFLCITDLGAEIVRDLTNDKIGKHFSFADYLKTAKHHMLHQWDKKKRMCCACPKPGCSIKKTVNLSKNIFEKLFVYVKGVCNNGYIRKNGTLVQICVCEYNVRNVSITELDLTELNSLLLNSPLSSLLTPSENNKLSSLINVRNKVCHAIGSNIFSELDLTLLWTELFEALCKLSTIQSKYLKMMIEDKKQKDLSETEMTELLLKVDKIEKVMRIEGKSGYILREHNHDNLDTIELTKSLATDVEDIKISHKRLEEDNRNLREQVGELTKTVKNVTASISFSKSPATPGSHLEGISITLVNTKEIDIKMNLPTIDEDKMRIGLEMETSLNKNDGLIFNAVKQGCILLEMSALSNIFSSEKILNSTMQALVEKILIVGEVNTSEKAEIFLELCIKSPLTAEEEKNIRNVCAGSSQFQSDFRNKILDIDILQDWQGMCSF